MAELGHLGDHVLRTDGRNGEVAPGRFVAREDNERVPQGCDPGSMARPAARVAGLSGRGAVLRVTDAEANVPLAWALRPRIRGAA